MRRAPFISTLMLFGAILLFGTTALRAQQPRVGGSRLQTPQPFADVDAKLKSAYGPPVAESPNRPAEKGTKITPPSTANAARPSNASAPWTTFGALAVVIALILVSAKLWKKHGPLAAGAIPPEAVEMLGRKMVDQRQAIHLVRLGSRILVLGSSATGLRTLAEITDPVEVDFLAGLCQRKNDDGGARESFRTLFKKQSPEQPAAVAPTATITTSAPRARAERDLEKRLRRTGDIHRDGDLERIHG